MVISKEYARRLIAAGKARVVTPLVPDEHGRVYVAIDRLDLQRTDHYLAE